jgi:YD repeat-containing protein
MILMIGVLASADTVTAQTQSTVAYTYDALGRVLTATYTGGLNNGLTVTYTYDAAGNRKTYTSTGGTPRIVVVPLLGFTLIVAG